MSPSYLVSKLNSTNSNALDFAMSSGYSVEGKGAELVIKVLGSEKMVRF